MVPTDEYSGVTGSRLIFGKIIAMFELLVNVLVQQDYDILTFFNEALQFSLLVLKAAG